jgi:tRNA dimethylallyltransferase
MPPPPENFADALVLTGPTGSGKSSLALDLAATLNAEIVSADSMTVYRHMDIGTAKPTAAERARVPHHLIDALDPWQSASVAWWLEAADAACRDIRSRGKRPLFVGGTPFYLKALRFGLFDAPPSDPELRQRLEAEATADRLGVFDRLRKADPKAAARLHPNDIRRVARALEVFTLTGRPISDFQTTWDNPGFGNNPPPIGLPWAVIEWPRAELYARIDRRVEAMLAAGWLDEVRRLRELPQPLSREAGQALGYAELFAVLDGELSPDAATGAIQTRTRQFAKRQLTWFRGLRPGTATPFIATSDDLYEDLTRHYASSVEGRSDFALS